MEHGRKTFKNSLNILFDQKIIQKQPEKSMAMT